MKILIYGLNYTPELTGVGKYTGEMAAWLAARGHEVRVVTAPPYYPSWRVEEHYRSGAYRVETASGKAVPKVYRCPIWVPARPCGLARLLHLLSFAVSSAPIAAMQVPWSPEIVFAVEPTFFAAPIALLVAFLSGAESWLHVQDFEVDAAFEMKFLPGNGRMRILAKCLECFFTSRFSRVSTISRKMVEQIVAKGCADSDVVLFPNWGDVESVRPALRGAPNPFRDDLGLKEKILFLYSGTMGAKQGLDRLVPLVESFKHDPRVHFIFCGDGVYRSHFERLVRNRSNVTMLSLQPPDRLNDLLNAADIHLLPQCSEVRDLVMPSKLNGIFASGRPVIAIADRGTQVAEAVTGCGLVVPPDDDEALFNASLRLVASAELRNSLGLAAREYAVKFLSKELVLRRFELEMMALLTPTEKTEEIPLARSYRG